MCEGKLLTAEALVKVGNFAATAHVFLPVRDNSVIEPLDKRQILTYHGAGSDAAAKSAASSAVGGQYFVSGVEKTLQPPRLISYTYKTHHSDFPLPIYSHVFKVVYSSCRRTAPGSWKNSHVSANLTRRTVARPGKLLTSDISRLSASFSSDDSWGSRVYAPSSSLHLKRL